MDAMDRLEQAFRYCVHQNNTDLFLNLRESLKEFVPPSDVLLKWNMSLSGTTQGKPIFTSYPQKLCKLCYEIFAKYYPKVFEEPSYYFGYPASNVKLDYLNPERKEAFFVEKASAHFTKTQMSTFSASVPKMEHYVKKDVADMSKDEIIRAIENLRLMSWESIKFLKGILRVYVVWCREKNYCSEKETGVEQFSIQDIMFDQAISQSYISSVEELISIFESVSSTWEIREEVPLACLAWYGLSLDEGIALKLEDVDLLHGVVQTKKGPVQLDYEPHQVLIRYHAVEYAYRESNLKVRRYMKASTGHFVERSVYEGSKKNMEEIKKPNVISALYRTIEKYNAIRNSSLSLTFSDIALMGNLSRLYDIYQTSGVIVDIDIATIFGITGTDYSATVKIREKKSLFDSYCRVREDMK